MCIGRDRIKPNTHGIKKYVGENDIYWGRGVWWRNGDSSTKDSVREISLVSFRNAGTKLPLELKIGFSFVSIENAKMNIDYKKRKG
jgi:putative alpha-1,2-mannosidase